MFATLLLLVAMFVLFVVSPACIFVHQERRHRFRWRRRRRVSVPEPPGGTPFRDDEPGVAERAREYTVEELGAPPLVKVVAVTSLVLGHMIVPGILAGLIGLMVYGVGLVAIPGLVLAARIYRNAGGLLACEPAAAKQARELHDFAVMLNVVVLGVVAFLLVVSGMHPLLSFTAGYAVLSLLHAAGLERAAAAIDAAQDDTERATAPSSASPRPRPAV